MGSRLNLLFIVLILFGVFLRFYKLDFGQGLYTHPDEYHIVASVNQLSFPSQMHPHFFSYGTTTIYTIYFTQALIKTISLWFTNQHSTLDIFLLGRFYSAFYASLTLLIVYYLTKLFLEKRLALL